MPFGLHGVAATFQQLMDQVFRDHIQYAAAYIDDIIIYSPTWQQHLEDLRTVLQALCQASLTANPAKCAVGLAQTQYLGHIVGGGSVRPVMDKVWVLQAQPRPWSKKEVQRFLGLAGYYRSFIPGYSTLAAPLTDLTKGKRGQPWVWTLECEGAFKAVKEALCSAPILRAPDFRRPFTVQTDVSGVGLGAVLSQGEPPR